ncbi:LysR family transcriptional regulator [Vibrio sp. SCSIO 43136]|uniref:LysR family transcriptional regulator n=1 Tax=Vibrio sp. SCSIO 43136 TaxID=2819101 RepID=UPI0020762BB3|nr:LysR family transcriptional regulator [Vibrio sp. SCSIO 43136]USD64296.1 LysR family transcriptional regulator [Vibrio sp. SCSIO 43136]
MISFEQVTCFTHVYELQSFSKASVKLGKARSTVRERIAALEDMMAVELFVIEGKKAVPTEYARRLYPRARLLARQALEFENIALSAYQGELSNITLYHDSLTPTAMLIEIESEIKSLVPNVSIHWLQRDRHHCLAEIESGEVLLAIMPGLGNIHPSSAIGSVNLGAYPLGIYTATDSDIPTQPIALAELTTRKQLITENDLNNALRHTKMSSVYEVVTSKQFLMEKLMREGWSVVAQQDAQAYLERGQLRRVDLLEAPASIRQDCIMFYNLSSEASEQETKIVQAVSDVAKRIGL